jgi:hypothetical protein
MKFVGAISTAVLSLSLGIGIPAFAQQEQHDQQEENKDKPAQETEKKAQPEQSAKPEEKNAQETNTKPNEKAAQPDKNIKPEEKNAQEQHTEQAKPEQQSQRAGANGGSIPAEKFKANFGQQHRFRVSQADYSNHRFQYGGYSFGFVDAWPSNWLYTQDVYVIEINGVYYLCNANYPGVNLTLSIVL